MKKRFIFLAFTIILCLTATAQEQRFIDRYRAKAVLRKLQTEDFMMRLKDSLKAEAKSFRDSINEVVAQKLAAKWSVYKLQKDVVRLPMPKAPVFKQQTRQRASQPCPPLEIEDAAEPSFAVEPFEVLPQSSAQSNRVVCTFYGRTLHLNKVRWTAGSITDISERGVSAYWRALSSMDIKTMLYDIIDIHQQLNLDDWGLYILAYQSCRAYYPNSKFNDRIFFTVYVLNQLGYRARIGRSKGRLYALLATNNSIDNTSYFTFGNSTRYYLISHDHKQLQQIECSDVELDQSSKKMSILLQWLPELGNGYRQIARTYNNKQYLIDYNLGLCSYLSTYPCIKLSYYAKAPMDQRTLQSFKTQFGAEFNGKSQRDKVNFLLHFVQNAFHYKTDEQNYGYEKWNFAEETIISKHSDCEDRAILFAQLVRHLLQLRVVLIHYPGIHLAAAVEFNEQVGGSSVRYNGSKYVICDPTYINANVGMDMPDLKGRKVEIYPI